MINAQTSEKIYSVSEYTSIIKNLLESQLGGGWVRGEISNMRKQGTSGHFYFTLKDHSAQISAVLFKGNAANMSRIPAEGDQVLLFGELSVYEPRGTYQLIVRVIMPDGIGLLQQQFEALKSKLAQEGLFDPSKKRKIPTLPHHIAIITSPSGAAIKDFISILKRRNFKARLTILPALVQGKDAHNDIIRQLTYANNSLKPDVIVLMRGGGSLEDLWPFNEEPLVRAIAKSSIPTISAVGHEIDFTLSDFAADLRAETPSAAAEIISSGFLDWSSRLSQAKKLLLRELNQKFHLKILQITHLQTSLKSFRPDKLITNYQLRLDDLHTRLSQSILPNLKSHKNHLQQLQIRLENSSIPSTLKRGYAIVKDAQNHIIKSTHQLPSAKPPISLIFHDGIQTLPQ